MINLLPPDYKSGYIYARRNVSLRKWAIAFIIALIGLGGMTPYALATFKESGKEDARQISLIDDKLERENYEQVETRVEEIGSSFKLVVQVLEQEVLFSKLLDQVGTAMPAQASLAELNISQTKGAIDISANTLDYATAAQLQVNLSDPNNKIFSKADILNITCNKPEPGKPYPCVTSIRALFAEDNPFLFINSQGKRP